MEQHITGDGGEPLTGDDWLELDRQGRAIAVEYALKPAMRNLAASAGGVVMERGFASHSRNYRALADRLPDLEPFFGTIPARADPARLTPYWDNDWFPPLDAISLCALVYLNRPRRYVEVGSGNSTKFVRHLIKHMGLDTRIFSIDPFPRADIDELCDVVVRKPLEDLDVGFFDDLDARDILFIDSSHRSFQNSDVTVFFLEILPKLASGMIYGIHDIFLPYDYPESFVPRFYNEQYLLAAYLLGGTRDEIVFPCHYVAKNPTESAPFRQLGERLGLGEEAVGGGAFWARKA